MKCIVRLILLALFISVMATGQAEAQKTLRSIYVINEGAFLQGNASVTRYDAASGTVTQNAFFAKNGRPLGDVANSASIIGDYLYVVVNNSHTVEVAVKEDLESVARIEIDDTNGGSPRQLLQVDENRAFVTNLFDNSISVINLTTNTVTGTFPVAGFPEGLVMAGGKVFVALSGLGSGNSVAVVDPVAMEVTNTLLVGDNPR
jgi:YVTN family beta-propeller protein